MHSLGRASTFANAVQILVRDKEHLPNPLLDAVLQQSADGKAQISSASGILPDVFIFYSAEAPDALLPVVDRPQTYELWWRTGGLNAFMLKKRTNVAEER